MKVAIHVSLAPTESATLDSSFDAWLGGGGSSWYPPRLNVAQSAGHSELFRPLVHSLSPSGLASTSASDLQEVVSEARHRGVERLVLSSRNLGSATVQDIGRIADVLGVELEVLVVTVAAPAVRWAYAWEQQIRSGRVEPPSQLCNELLSTAALNPGRLEELVSNFPAERRSVRLVGGQEPDLPQQVALLLGIEVNPDWVTVTRPNDELGRNVEKLRRLNSLGVTTGWSLEAEELVAAFECDRSEESATEADSPWVIPAAVGLAAIDEVRWLKGVAQDQGTDVVDPLCQMTSWLSLDGPEWYAQLARGASNSDWEPKRLAAVTIRALMARIRELQSNESKRRSAGSVTRPGGPYNDMPTKGDLSMLAPEFADYETARTYSLLRDLDLTSNLGLEIGPLNTPIVHSHFNVRYADHVDSEGLRAKYANDPGVPDLSKIEDVHFIFDGRPLAEVTGDSTFDYIIASHVIEHVPNLIGWLNELSGILRPGGTLRFAIPDRRFTFDYLRAESTLTDALAANVVGASRPQPRQIIDFVLNTRTVSAAEAWKHNPSLGAIEAHQVESAIALSLDAVQNHVYHDVHCWVFTPESFALLMADLASADMVQLGCDRFVHTARGMIEFYVVARPMALKDAVASWLVMAEEAREIGGSLRALGLSG